MYAIRDTRASVFGVRLIERLALLAVGLSVGACPAPDLDDAHWRCELQSDCGPGFLCDATQGHCVAAYRDENGVFDDRLLFGMSAALGSDVSLGVVGKAARAGIGACFAQVNRSGGVHGRRLELVVMNDSYDAERTAANVAQLIGGADRQVFALTGVIGTAPSLAAREIALRQRAIFFGPATGHDALEPDPPDRYVFNTRPRYAEEAAQLTRYLLQKADPPVPPQNVSVFAQGDDEGQLDAFGRSGFAGVARSLQELGVDDDGIERATYPSANTQAVSGAVGPILRWMASGERVSNDEGEIPIGVLMVPVHDAAAAFVSDLDNQLARVRRGSEPVATYGEFDARELKQLEKVRVHFATLSTVGVGLAASLKAHGSYETRDDEGRPLVKRHGEGMLMALPVPHYEAGASGVIRYREHLEAYDASLEPGFVSLEAYLTATLLVEGLRAHGRDLTTESFVDTLETLSVDLGIGTPLGFSESDHQATSKLWGVRVNHDLGFDPIGVLAQ